MGIKLTNNAFGTLAAGINSSATSITLTSGQGARFPTLGAGDYFYATLIDTSNNLEIVKCTARSTDVLTVTRAQESTTARSYSAGDRIEIRLTAQTFIDAVAEIGPTQVSDEANTSTGYFDLPSGTTAQRPGSPAPGMVRFNTDFGYPEWYDSNATSWVSFSTGASYSADYLAVAGGGSGDGGGGGAGGYVASTFTASGGAVLVVTIGAGGTNVNTNNAGNSGSNTTITGSGISTVTAVGGGRAGYTAAGTGGGSGGGGGHVGYSGGAGTSGQGNAGGTGGSTAGAGGGGAGAAGGNASGGSGGTGGAGLNWQSLGTFYAGGGGGGGSAASGSGGAGGGGAGASAVGTAGTANTGGGGGGVYQSYPAGSGGSGVVIIRYPGNQRASGGTVTQSGGYTYHTFTSSGTFTA